MPIYILHRYDKSDHQTAVLAVFLIENTEYRNLFKTFHFLEFASGWCLVSVLCNGAMWSCGPMCATKTLSDGQAHPAAPSWTLLGHTEGHPAHRHPAEMCLDHFQALGSRRNSSPIVDHLFVCLYCGRARPTVTKPYRKRGKR